MGIRLPEIILHAKQITHRQIGFEVMKHRPASSDVPKGHFVVYVGEDEEERKRFVVPLSYLKNPLFQELLSKAAEEFGFEHQFGGITIPCAQDHFLGLTSRLNTPIS
ncbi:auxin-responsive protein SAUR21-like [Cucurbita pepo subsp. pepo]|uniref:Auxin-responsive protein SAUR21-like n=1 Tax=Cucurbita moschata TaxID=3662 RepID=A0A6J1EK13_CUCMO|nr:auxin-responsive protein SAUR21-like [Cucurbita moschata]XP_023529823.1 auxin-responsive protein SAUR21-like [Cucurbita pepo subsp. pepo]